MHSKNQLIPELKINNGVSLVLELVEIYALSK
jgi:hypothetical protein